MDTIILLLVASGVILTLMTIAFLVGRGSMLHDPYNFVQHHDTDAGDIIEETKVAPAITRELAERMWKEHVINQPTKEIRSIKL